jgi:hypothetical protein
MFLEHLRADVKAAALAGLWAALAELQAGEPDHHAAAEALRARLPAQRPAGGLDLIAEARAAGIALPEANDHARGRAARKRGGP